MEKQNIVEQMYMGRKMKRALEVINKGGEQDRPVRTEAAGNMQEKMFQI